MAGKQGKKLTSWVFVYAALVVAVVFASQSGTAAARDLATLSPVVLGGNAPALPIRAVVRRSDI